MERDNTMANSEQKRKAAAAARLYLEMRGFSIVEQNFRRPKSLIDIIAKKQATVYFVEIQYHREAELPAAASSTTNSDRIQELELGAAGWIEETKWAGDHRFASIEISGSDFLIMGFIDNLF
jgi:Holliday junction resolvase-like predicted endonuclease